VFQPRSATFQADVGADIREVLEAALRQHSCLTRGDWLTVQHAIGGSGGGSGSGGEAGVEQQQDVQQQGQQYQQQPQYQRYDLKVCELHPEGAGAVSVIDTDLEAEINPSIETEERIREEYEAAAQRAAEAALAAAAAARQQQEAEAAAVEEAAQRERWRLAKEAALPPEPPAGAAGPTAACLFRFPDGGRHSRRFLLSSPLQVGEWVGLPMLRTTIPLQSNSRCACWLPSLPSPASSAAASVRLCGFQGGQRPAAQQLQLGDTVSAAGLPACR
jgi:ubiquitin fusion degradation protein 1